MHNLGSNRLPRRIHHCCAHDLHPTNRSPHSDRRIVAPKNDDARRHTDWTERNARGSNERLIGKFLEQYIRLCPEISRISLAEQP